MQVIHFYFVSIFLSCVKLRLTVGVMTLNPTTPLLPGVVSSQKNNHNSAFLSFNGNHLTKNYPKITSKPLSLNNSSDCKITVISAVKKNNADPFTSQDYNYDQLEDTFYDNPGPPGTPPFNLYKATVGVVKAVFNNLKSLQEKKMTQEFTIANVIENSFRNFDDIALTVTGSMSILYFLKINSYRLGKAFNCLFDAKHMVKSDEYRENFMSKMQSLIEDIAQVRDLNNPLIHQYDNIDLVTIVENLENVLFNYKVGNYNYRDINVNIKLMKSMVLINQTDSKILNKLITSISKEFLEEVKHRQYEIDGLLIAKQHSEVIRKVMPGIFSLLMNHIELLKIFSTREVHKENKKIIQFASKLLKTIMSTFINRFKNFGNLTEEELSDIDVLEELIKTLDTGETETIEAPSTSKIDIELLLPLTERAIAAVLNLTGKKATQNWKDHNVFKFKNFLENQDDEYYMNLLTHNADISYLLVNQFEGSFLDEVDYIMANNGGNDEVFFL